MMRVFTCTDHAGVWPVGVASVVVAPDEEHARQLLAALLSDRGLIKSNGVPFTLSEVPLDVAHAVILQDGDY